MCQVHGDTHLSLNTRFCARLRDVRGQDREASRIKNNNEKLDAQARNRHTCSKIPVEGRQRDGGQ